MKAKSLEVDLVIWEMETKGRAFQKRWDTKSRGRWVSVSRPEPAGVDGSWMVAGAREAKNFESSNREAESEG